MTLTPTDFDHYIAIFGDADAEDVAGIIADIRAAADPLAAVHEATAWGYVEEEIAQVADLWCRMHGRPLTEVWKLAAKAHDGYADNDQAEALRALVGMVPVPGSLVIETQQEPDGRWIAEIPAMPGCHVYGVTRWEAIGRVVELAAEVGRDG